MGSPPRSGTSSSSRAARDAAAGTRGCWEQVASGRAIGRLGRQAAARASGVGPGRAGGGRPRERHRTHRDRGRPEGRPGRHRGPGRGGSPAGGGHRRPGERPRPGGGRGRGRGRRGWRPASGAGPARVRRLGGGAADRPEVPIVAARWRTRRGPSAPPTWRLGRGWARPRPSTPGRGSVKVGVVLPLFSGDPGKVLDAARSAEDLGFDGVFAFDHFFPPGAPPDRPALEAFTTLAAVASVTRGSHRHAGDAGRAPPGRDAGQACLDARSDLGRPDDPGDRNGRPHRPPGAPRFGFPNLSVNERRAHLVETVTALKALFRGEVYEGGEHIPRLEGPLLPPPVRPGGRRYGSAPRRAVIRLAASLADGWNGWALGPSEFAGRPGSWPTRRPGSGRAGEATWAGIVLVGEDQAETDRLLARRAARRIRRRGLGGPAEGFAEHLRRWTRRVPPGR